MDNSSPRQSRAHTFLPLSSPFSPPSVSSVSSEDNPSVSSTRNRRRMTYWTFAISLTQSGQGRCWLRFNLLASVRRDKRKGFWQERRLHSRRRRHDRLIKYMKHPLHCPARVQKRLARDGHHVSRIGLLINASKRTPC